MNWPGDKIPPFKFGAALPFLRSSRKFILELYHATPITGRTWLHGLKGGRMVHVGVVFKKIPREVLDKNAVEQGDVKFFELGALAVDAKQKGRELTLKLIDFAIPTDDIPEEARKAIKHWSQLVDYWAVDWDHNYDTFHNQWQSYRTRKDPKIELQAKYTYPAPGKYSLVVKVIDILGNDTTKTVEVDGS